MKKRKYNPLFADRKVKEDNYIERLSRTRKNILNILRYGHVVPFNWHTKGYTCFYCRKSIQNCDVLKDHTLKHSINLETFIPKRIITKDVPIKVDVSKLKCKSCPEIIVKDLEELISHIIEKHEVNYYPEVGCCVLPFVLKNDAMNCVLCGSIFDNFTSMIGHMHKEHVTQSCVCQVCGLSFISQVRLKRHIYSSHEEHKCPICLKTFNASYRLEKHKQRFHGQTKIFECTLCDTNFESKYQLKVHLGKMHNVDKFRIKCEHCPKIGNSKAAMILHMQSQHSDLKYACDQCNYRTGVKFLITLHMRKHFGIKEYSCSICEKLFRRSSNLRAHMKVHSGVCGRVCRYCRKGFLDLETLNRHEAEYHNLVD